jgi:hypothetical protein
MSDPRWLNETPQSPLWNDALVPLCMGRPRRCSTECGRCDDGA